MFFNLKSRVLQEYHLLLTTRRCVGNVPAYVPWIRVVSDAKAGVPVARSKKAIQAVVSGDGVVQESAEVTRHVLRGHYPSELLGMCAGSWSWTFAEATKA